LILKTIEIRMLGEFSLTAGEHTIRDLHTRSKKAWILLAYLIRYRDSVLPPQRLIGLLWGEEADSANPENALRITLHRLRGLLDRLWPGAGRELILYREGGYQWNPQIPVALDCDRFEQLYAAAAADPRERLSALLAALEFYRGPYLPRQSSELWAVPAATHYANLYLLASMEAAELLSQQDRHREAALLCQTAAAAEPYHEGLHALLIREMAAAGDPKGAAGVYDALAQRLSDEFGILPGEEARAALRCIASSGDARILPIEEVLGHLQEPSGKEGAMVCDYEHFKVLCYAESRSMLRSGNVSHVALLRLCEEDGESSSRSRNRVMEQLGDALRTNLRRGDVISRCSGTQYILLLRDANYENSCMVCRRIIAAFRRQHPHTHGQIHFMVQPLTPAVRVP